MMGLAPYVGLICLAGKIFVCKFEADWKMFRYEFEKGQKKGNRNIFISKFHHIVNFSQYFVFSTQNPVNFKIMSVIGRSSYQLTVLQEINSILTLCHSLT